MIKIARHAGEVRKGHFGRPKLSVAPDLSDNPADKPSPTTPSSNSHSDNIFRCDPLWNRDFEVRREALQHFDAFPTDRAALHNGGPARNSPFIHPMVLQLIVLLFLMQNNMDLTLPWQDRDCLSLVRQSGSCVIMRMGTLNHLSFNSNGHFIKYTLTFTAEQYAFDLPGARPGLSEPEADKLGLDGTGRAGMLKHLSFNCNSYFTNNAFIFTADSYRFNDLVARWRFGDLAVRLLWALGAFLGRVALNCKSSPIFVLKSQIG